MRYICYRPVGGHIIGSAAKAIKLLVLGASSSGCLMHWAVHWGVCWVSHCGTPLCGLAAILLTHSGAPNDRSNGQHRTRDHERRPWTHPKCRLTGIRSLQQLSFGGNGLAERKAEHGRRYQLFSPAGFHHHIQPEPSRKRLSSLLVAFHWSSSWQAAT